MAKCNQCGVHILDQTEYCPLCQNVIEDSGGINLYPNIPRKLRAMLLVFRIILFQAIIVSGLCIFVNYYYMSGVYWCWIVTALESYCAAMFYVMQKEGIGYRARTITGILGAVIIGLVVDEVLGFAGWSLDYVLPAIVILVHIALVILMIVNRRNWQSYLILQMGLFVISLLLIILIALGYITSPTLSFVAIALGVIVLLGTFIFGGNRSMDELKRRFHI